MSKTKFVMLILLCCMVSTITGALAGFYAAVKTPSVSNVAVLDIDQLATKIDPNDPQFVNKSIQLSEKTKQITGQLTAAGMVVLDRAQVISAPTEAIIHVELPTN